MDSREQSLAVKISLPSSKSISNRLLLLRKVSGVSFSIHGISEADDTVRMNELLENLSPVVNAMDGGTTLRFLLPFLCMLPGEFLLTGTERMQERPIKELVDALVSLGADIRYVEKSGYPPLLITGGSLHGGDVFIDPSRSSQFVSALLLVAPFLKGGLRLRLSMHPVSATYIEMTLKTLSYFSIAYQQSSDTIDILPQTIAPRDITVEADWSAAAFWFQLAALLPGRTFILKDLCESGWQGDQAALCHFEKMGVKAIRSEEGISICSDGAPSHGKEWYFDLNHTPDLAPAIILTVVGLRSKAIFKGLEHLRYKESDRVEIIAGYIRSCGVTMVHEDDVWKLDATNAIRSKLVIDPHNDHRLAMSFAMLSVAGWPVSVIHPTVVSKSYPNFWDEVGKVQAL